MREHATVLQDDNGYFKHGYFKWVDATDVDSHLLLLSPVSSVRLSEARLCVCVSGVTVLQNALDKSGKTALELCENVNEPDWQSAASLLRFAMSHPVHHPSPLLLY